MFPLILTVLNRDDKRGCCNPYSGLLVEDCGVKGEFEGNFGMLQAEGVQKVRTFFGGLRGRRHMWW